jgi:hypothetical protein
VGVGGWGEAAAVEPAVVPGGGQEGEWARACVGGQGGAEQEGPEVGGRQVWRLSGRQDGVVGVGGRYRGWRASGMWSLSR